MLIYHKKNGQWRQILADSSLGDTRYGIERKDWNNDGVGDISYTYSKSWSSSTDLWPTSHSGEQIHRIERFTDLDNPELDSATGYITENFIHADNGYYGRYRFVNDTLQNIDGVRIYRQYDPKAKVQRDVYTIDYERNGKIYREKEVLPDELYKHVPKAFQEDVKGYYY